MLFQLNLCQVLLFWLMPVALTPIFQVLLATKERRYGRSEGVTNLQLIEEKAIFSLSISYLCS